jgi:hypothetical protein
MLHEASNRAAAVVEFSGGGHPPGGGLRYEHRSSALIGWVENTLPIFST